METTLVDVDSLSSTATTADVDVMFDAAGNAIAGFKITDTTSDVYRAAKRANDVANVKRAAARKKQIDATSDAGAGALLDVGQQNAKLLAMALVVDWYGFAKAGEALKFDPAVLSAMLDKRPGWVDKITAKAEEAASFLAS